MSPKDRSCIVTGGFGALGSVVVGHLTDAGARVAVVDHAAAVPSTSIIGYGGVDLADPVAATLAIDAAAGKLGGLYALINIAGAFRSATLADGDVATWDFLFAANLKSAVCATKAALPHLIAAGLGRVVNIGAGAAAKAGVGMGAYAASKAGIAKLTEACSEEVKGKGITVNAVLPSIIDTLANRKEMPKGDFSKWVKPKQVAALIAFLLSDEASAITGALIPISGLV